MERIPGAGFVPWQVSNKKHGSGPIGAEPCFFDDDQEIPDDDEKLEVVFGCDPCVSWHIIDISIVRNRCWCLSCQFCIRALGKQSTVK